MLVIVRKLIKLLSMERLVSDIGKITYSDRICSVNPHGGKTVRYLERFMDTSPTNQLADN